MKQKFQGSAKAKKQYLQALRSYEMLRMKSEKSISEYFSKVTMIVNKLRVHGEKIEDVTIVTSQKIT